MASQARRYIADDELEPDLSWKMFGHEETKLLARELATNTTLKQLDLSGNRFNDDGAVALATAVATNKSLTGLRLYLNGIGDVGLSALADSLMQNESLERFVVQRNGLSSSIVLASFANVLKINRGLKELDLCRNSIDDVGTTILADGLKVNTTLTYLDLSFNIFEDDGATSILNALAGWNTTLTTLKLWGNENISETIRSAIKAFVDANRAGIRFLHAAGELDLSSKEIGNGGAVARDLADNTTVTTLVLNKNKIGQQGCADIADALVKNCF
jgi:Ran GTPase-activating protein (RanGAP) involved in mRNA processing and transport